MNFSEFLLIDAVSAITIFLVLFLLKGRKTDLYRSSNKKEKIKKDYSQIPEIERLLELEKVAIIEGSGINFDSLIGNWKFISIYKKDMDYEDYIFSSLLRFFSASMELKKETSKTNTNQFSIITSIKFGFFIIRFSGSGYLKGKQPLLTYFFNLIELKSGSAHLISRSLNEPLEKEKSFFALIAPEESSNWISARGQAGSLIFWLKD